MIRIALDLELEQPKTNHQTPDSLLEFEEKIIQVGYVVFDDNTGEYLKEVCKEVNIGVAKLSTFITKLTGVTTEMMLNGTTLVSIIDELHQDVLNYNTSRKILTWGGGDQPCIEKELPAGYPWKLGRSSFNVKHLYQLYQETNGLNPSGGLKKSMTKVGLTFGPNAHNALADAKATARMFIRLCELMDNNNNNKEKELKTTLQKLIRCSTIIDNNAASYIDCNLIAVDKEFWKELKELAK